MNKTINRTFKSWESASLVCSALRERLEKYGKVSIMDYYNILGCKNCLPSDTEWGWVDLRDGRIESIIERGMIEGFTLILPAPILLEIDKVSDKWPESESLVVEFDTTGLEPSLFVCRPSNNGPIYISRCRGEEATRIYNLLLGKKEGAKVVFK